MANLFRRSKSITDWQTDGPTLFRLYAHDFEVLNRGPRIGKLPYQMSRDVLLYLEMSSNYLRVEEKRKKQIQKLLPQKRERKGEIDPYRLKIV